MRELVDIEIVADRTEGSLANEGFLRVTRLLVRNHYADGTTSEAYPCDVMSPCSSRNASAHLSRD